METFFTWPLICSVDLMTCSKYYYTRCQGLGGKKSIYTLSYGQTEEKKGEMGRKSDCTEQRRI